MLNTQAALALSPVVGLAAYCVTHVLVSRLTVRQNPYIALAVGFFAGLIAVAALTIALLISAASGFMDALSLSALNVLTYVALAFGYFNFVNLTLVSLRIRILDELAESGGSRSKQVLAAEYGNDDVATVRLDRLLRGGFLIDQDGRIHNGKSSFLLLARIFDWLRRLILGPTHRVMLNSPAGVAKETA